MAYTYLIDLASVNHTRLSGKVNKYIVIHYTGNTTDSAKSNANYFRSVNRGASANIFVDDNYVVQVVDNSNAAWHCGVDYSGGKAPFWGKCKNENSIGIEMCSVNGAISEATFNNTVTLTKNLMAKYGIPASNVIRHYDVCGKVCPGWSGWGTRSGDNGAIWARFKNAITETPNTQPYVIAGESNALYTFKVNNETVVRVAPNSGADAVTKIKAGSLQGVNQITKDGWGHIGNNAGWILLKGNSTPMNNTTYNVISATTVKDIANSNGGNVATLQVGSKQGICFISNSGYGLISNFAGWIEMDHLKLPNPNNSKVYVIAGESNILYTFKVNADTSVYIAPNTGADKVGSIKAGSLQGINQITKDGWGHIGNNAGWILLKGNSTPMNNTSYQVKTSKENVKDIGKSSGKVVTVLPKGSKQGICFINNDGRGLISNFTGWVVMNHLKKI